MLDPGARLGPYEIVALVGRGGMGDVYRARDARLERDVAIKVLPDGVAADAEALARFQREARALAAISHPNIRAIFDVGVENGLSYAVGEFLTGSTLRAALANGPLPVARAIEIAAAVADGLAAAHAKRIVHRDIKPENVFLTDSGAVKILDFGIARGGEEIAGSDAATAAQTRPGMVLGTMGYMAPEQVRGLPCGPSCDLFALGAVLYEMLTGSAPLMRDSLAEWTAALLRDQPPRPDQLRREVPRDAADVCMRCLAKEPVDRFASAADLAAALRETQLSASPTLRFRPTMRMRRRGIAAIAIVAVALAMLAAVAIVVRRRQVEAARVIDAGYAIHAGDVTATPQALRLFELAMRADADGDRPQATNLLEESARIDPHAPLPPAFLCLWVESAGDHSAAAKWGDDARRLVGPDTPTYEALLVRYLVDRALTTRERPFASMAALLRLRPEAWRLRLAVAHFRIALRENDAALHELQRIDATNLDDRRLALVIADRASLGDVAGAEAALARIRRGDAIHLYAEARIAWSKGRIAESVALYDKTWQRATGQNLPDIAVDARLLAAVGRIILGSVDEAQKELELAAAAAADAHQLQTEFIAHGFTAYAAELRGDAAARDLHLAAATRVAAAADNDATVTLRDLALRMHSDVVTRPERVAEDRNTLGANALLGGRLAYERGDRAAAASALQQARLAGIDSTYLAEEAALLASDLGAPAARFPLDPPYANHLRWIAILEMQRSARR